VRGLTQLRNSRTGKEERKRRLKMKRYVSNSLRTCSSSAVADSGHSRLQDLEMMNDEAVANLRSKMLQAAERDVEENEAGRPAVHKLRMLPQVVDLMQK